MSNLETFVEHLFEKDKLKVFDETLENSQQITLNTNDNKLFVVSVNILKYMNVIQSWIEDIDTEDLGSESVPLCNECCTSEYIDLIFTWAYFFHAVNNNFIYS